MGATLGPALIGEWLSHVTARNMVLIGSAFTNTSDVLSVNSFERLYGLVSRQALIVSMKEIYGWLLIAAIAMLIILALSYSNVRPFAIFPKWSSIRRSIRRLVRFELRAARG